MKLDMHCHTNEGSPDSKVHIEDYMRSLKEQGFDGMLVTDHDSYDGYRYYENHHTEWKDLQDFVVLKGIEYDTFDAGHMVIVMPSGVDMKIFEHKGLRVKTLIKIVHLFGGIIGPAHPCGEPFLSIFSTGRFKRDISFADNFDFIEGYNSGEDDLSNLTARQIAQSFDKPVTGGSDSHWMECVGLACTILDERVTSENELISYIRKKKPTTVSGEQYMGTIKERIGKWNKFLVYGFFPYNKFGAAVHRRKRNAELANIRWELKNLREKREDELKKLRHLKKHIDSEHSGNILEHIGEIIEHEKFKTMGKYRQHGQISTLEHCQMVTVASDKLSRFLRLKNIDRGAMLRGALLHDFYLYDWHHEDGGVHKWHGYHHADKAKSNAVEIFDIGDKEQEIIHTHMWPLNITRLPKSKEAWIVCLADKYISTKETLFNRS